MGSFNCGYYKGHAANAAGPGTVDFVRLNANQPLVAGQLNFKLVFILLPKPANKLIILKEFYCRHLATPISIVSHNFSFQVAIHLWDFVEGHRNLSFNIPQCGGTIRQGKSEPRMVIVLINLGDL